MRLNDRQVDLRFLNLAIALPKDYGRHAFQLNLATLSLNGVLSSDSSFMIGSFGQWYVVHAAACNGINGSICKDKAYQCEICFAVHCDYTKLRR